MCLQSKLDCKKKKKVWLSVHLPDNVLWFYRTNNIFLQEHFIWGAEIRKAVKNYHRHLNYELKFNKYTVIERADGEPVLLENGTSASHTSIAQTTGPEETKRRKVQFEPIPLKEVLENGKSRPPFGKYICCICFLKNAYLQCIIVRISIMSWFNVNCF